MKKYSLYAVLLLFITSCSSDFLDRNPLDQPSNETFWNTEKDALAAATGCYEGWFSMDEVVYFDCASDNAYNPFPWEGWQVQATGYATANDYGQNYMKYDKIVRCNNFLANIDRPEMSEEIRSRLTAEVRFLRAWHYFLKVTLYGDVPLVKEVLDVNNSYLPRTPKAEVVKFILDELNEIAPLLPETYASSDAGRVTKGAALTLKARMEIFEGDYAACAATCEQIMKLGYSLFPDYRGLFKIANMGNEEVILDVQYVENLAKNGILGVMPPASVGGWSSINPTQALADAYECIDGKTIEESPSYNPKDPYKDRDPRLAASLIYPGCLYEGSYFNPIDIKDPTGDYYAPYGRSKTGYHPRKYIDNLGDYADMWNTGMNAIVMRYAEVLLMYAESMNEQSKMTSDIWDKTIKPLRERAGFDAAYCSYPGSSDLRQVIRDERRVELALEGRRVFDLRRWALLDNPSLKSTGAAYLTTRATGAPFLDDGSKIQCQNAYNMKYWFPIPQKERDINANLPQNPGW